MNYDSLSGTGDAFVYRSKGRFFGDDDEQTAVSGHGNLVNSSGAPSTSGDVPVGPEGHSDRQL